MPFTDLIDKVLSASCAVQITKEWSQGRAGYGGLIAALVYQAMEKRILDGRPVRNLQISFIGPVSFEEPLEIETDILREGKSVSQIFGRGVQNGQTQITIVGSFGHSRDSQLLIEHDKKIFPENPEELLVMPYVEGKFPAFTKFFDLRYVTAFPFAGSSDTSLRGFVKFKSPQDKMGIAQLIGLVDAWPPTPLPMLDKPAPASSLSWTIEFMQPQPALGVDDYCQYESETTHASNGYGNTRAMIRNMNGELLAISSQTVTIFA